MGSKRPHIDIDVSVELQEMYGRLDIISTSCAGGRHNMPPSTGSGGPMYATDRRQRRIIAYMPPTLGAAG